MRQRFLLEVLETLSPSLSTEASPSTDLSSSQSLSPAVSEEHGSGSGSHESSHEVPIFEGTMKLAYWIALSSAALCVFLAICFSIKIIWVHLKNYDTPRLQRPIVRIVLLIPIYGIDSFLALLFPEYALTIEIIRDCYEAYVIYTFFSLIVSFLDGEDMLYRYLADQPPMKHPTPLCCFKFSPGGTFMHTCKQMVLQYVIISPLTALLAIILNIPSINAYHEGDFSPKYAYLWLVLIKNTSITLAMYYLVLFYMAAHEPLEKFRPMPKFLCIKAVVFFSFWQYVMIAIFVSLGWIPIHIEGLGETGRMINDWLMCIEMIFYALFFGYAFGYKTYKKEESDAVGAQIKGQIKSIINPMKFKSDMNDVKRIIHNFKDVMNQKDVVEETIEAFAKKGRRYLKKELESFLGATREDQMKRTLLAGSLEKKAKSLGGWKPRYFLLISDPAGLVYFDGDPYSDTSASTPISPNAVKGLAFPPLEYIAFADVYDIAISTKNNTEFKLVTKQRSWTLRAPSQNDRRMWVEQCKKLYKPKERLFDGEGGSDEDGDANV